MKLENVGCIKELGSASIIAGTKAILDIKEAISFYYTDKDKIDLCIIFLEVFLKTLALK